MKYTTPADHAAEAREVHPALRQPHIQPVSAPLHVIAVISNPMRYASRYRLYHAFAKQVAEAGAVLTTVELALRDRHFEVTTHHNPRHVQLRSPSILWHKENLINIGIRHLPADWQYVAWVDADVVFARPDWAIETVHLLQTYQVIQMWTHSIDLGPDGQPIAQCTSLLHNWAENEHILQPWSRRDNKMQPKPDKPNLHHGGDGSHVPPPNPDPNPPALLHTGYAWAARRSAVADLGGLGEIGILGSGDRHMAYALIGEVDKSFPNGIQPSYAEYWREWQRRAEKHITSNVGVMGGTLLHNWHGSKQHRRYQDRWRILVDDRFEWMRDVKHDPQGVLTWTGNNPRLERDCRQYFAVRNEDSVDL